MLTITNDGQAIASTNYWGLPHAARGLMYLSINGGAARLLVPAAAALQLAEMRTGKCVTIEASISQPGCLDLVFEDGSQSPFFVAIDRRQIDRALEPGRTMPLIIYTQAGEQMRLQAKVRA
jgi:hypothetical protein